MPKYLFLFLVFFTLVSMGLADDYSFTITGELPTVKLNPPSNIFQYDSDFVYQPRKKSLDLKTAPPIVVLNLNPPEKHQEIAYTPSKTIRLIDALDSPPDQLKEDQIFFNQDQLILFHKPVKFKLNDQKTGGIAINLISRKPLEIPEISYNSKVRTYHVPPPPKTDIVILKEERVYLMEDGVPFYPLKETTTDQSRISFGTVDLKEYRIGFSNPFLDALISNGTNRLFFKNDSIFIGAQASVNEMSALAFFPGFDFQMDLLDDTFVLRTTTELDPLPSFDFGLALLNTTPLPVINWYTTGSNILFSMGMDVFASTAYGLGVQLKNDPYLIRGATGYNFSTDAFHAMIDGKFTFNRGLFNAVISYNDGLSLHLGAAYQLIKNDPFSMNIYGNIDYKNDWLFSAGTKMRLGDVDLNVRIKFITGGLSFDVEAGYAF